MCFHSFLSYYVTVWCCGEPKCGLLCGDLFCVLIGGLCNSVSDCGTPIYSELALLTIKYLYPSWTSRSELFIPALASTGTLQNSSCPTTGKHLITISAINFPSLLF